MDSKNPGHLKPAVAADWIARKVGMFIKAQEGYIPCAMYVAYTPIGYSIQIAKTRSLQALLYKAL